MGREQVSCLRTHLFTARSCSLQQHSAALERTLITFQYDVLEVPPASNWGVPGRTAAPTGKGFHVVRTCCPLPGCRTARAAASTLRLALPVPSRRTGSRSMGRRWGKKGRPAGTGVMVHFSKRALVFSAAQGVACPCCLAPAAALPDPLPAWPPAARLAPLSCRPRLPSASARSCRLCSRQAAPAAPPCRTFLAPSMSCACGARPAPRNRQGRTHAC